MDIPDRVFDDTQVPWKCKLYFALHICTSLSLSLCFLACHVSVWILSGSLAHVFCVSLSTYMYTYCYILHSHRIWQRINYNLAVLKSANILAYVHSWIQVRVKAWNLSEIHAREKTGSDNSQELSKI